MNSVPIRELVERSRQCNPSELGRDEFVYIDISSVDRETKRIVAAQRIRSADAPSRARKQVHASDVILSTVRPNLNAVAFVPRELDREIASTGFAVLRAKASALDPSYLFYFLQSEALVSHLTRIANGASYPAISDDDVLDAPIPLPDLAEQKRIAAILEGADRLRRLRRYEIELAESLPAGFARTLCDLKRGNKWPLHELGELCAEVIDCPHSTPVFSPERTPYPCVRSSDIQNAYLDFSQTKYVNIDEYKKRVVRGAPHSGDVIYCREGARFGNAARVLDSIKLCLGQRMMLLRPKEKMATSEFV